MSITAKILIGVSLLIAVVALGVAFASYGSQSQGLGAAGPVQNTPWWFFNGLAIGHGDTPNHNGGTINGIIASNFSAASVTLGAFPNSTSTSVATTTVGGSALGNQCQATEKTLSNGVFLHCAVISTGVVSYGYENLTTATTTAAAGTISFFVTQ